MTRRTRGSRAALAGAVVALLAPLLGGCVALPQDGPVVGAGGAVAGLSPGPMYIDPLPPVAGETPAQVVQGFLDAMLATPVQTTTARSFLTEDAAGAWDPQRTITYAGASSPRGGGPVVVDLADTHLIDERGTWQGDLGDQALRFDLARQDGEWRIATPPDALVVPEQWFEERFRQVALAFLDPTGSIVVPEPAFVPEGDQLASALVRGLLAGPPGTSRGTSVSYLPAGLTTGLSVPVSDDGVADVALSGDAGPMDAEQAERMLAQLTTTLRQDPAVRSVRVSVDGVPLDLPGRGEEVRVDRGEQLAPYVARASRLLHGLREGLLVAGPPDDLRPVAGPFGTEVLGAEVVVPDLLASAAAAVTGGGTALLVGPVRTPGPVTEVLSGATDLLVPAWDHSDRLWVVDRTAAGARVLTTRPVGVPGPAEEVDVPGISGQDVRRLLVSRDGSRLVAVVRVDGSDRVVVSRVEHDPTGAVTGTTPAVRIDDSGAEPADGAVRVADLAWRSPTSLVLLTPVNEGLHQVRSLEVDGAPGGRSALATTIKGDVRQLVGSPTPGEPLWAAGPGLLVPLTGGGGPRDLDDAVTDLRLVG